MRRFLHFAIVASLAALPSVMPHHANAGKTAYGYLFGAKSGGLGFVSFDIDNPQTLTPIKTLSYGDVHVSAGEYVDGKIYTYQVEFGDFTEIYPYGWTVYDAETLNVLSENTSQQSNRVVDMAYDYTTNTMYALVEDKYNTGKVAQTSLYAVDLATGDYRLIGSPGELKAINGYGNLDDDGLITLACNAQGQLYAMSHYRYLYKMDKFTGKVNDDAPQHNLGTAEQFQSMAFDSDGTLWWAQAHPSYGHFCDVDLTTGIPGGFVDFRTDYEKLDKLGDDAQVTSLFFKDKAVNPQSPSAVTSLNAKAHEKGVQKVDISWTLPQTDYSGAAANVTGVKVYRIGTSEPIATLGSGDVSFTDENAPNGFVTYEVLPFNASGNGFPAFVEAFSGTDMLNQVQNVSVSLDGRTATLTWERPVSTVNGGYADFDAVTYNVYRVMAGNEEAVASATASTSFSETIETNGSFSYIIEPVCAGITGMRASSETFMLTSTASIPYSTSFEDDQDGTQWTIINNSARGWAIVDSYYKLEGKYAQASTGGSADNGNDWLISPAIQFNSGQHTLTFCANGASYDTHTVDVLLGTEKDNTESFTINIHTINNEYAYDKDGIDGVAGWKAYECDFTVPSAGVYHLAFHNKTKTTYANFRLDRVAIKAKDNTQSGVDETLAADGRQATVTVSGKDVYVTAGIAIGSMDVTDMRGRRNLSAAAAGTETAISCAHLPSGIYVLTINFEDGSRQFTKIAIR